MQDSSEITDPLLRSGEESQEHSGFDFNKRNRCWASLVIFKSLPLRTLKNQFKWVPLSWRGALSYISTGTLPVRIYDKIIRATEMDQLLNKGQRGNPWAEFVMIQCVGSRKGEIRA